MNFLQSLFANPNESKKPTISSSRTLPVKTAPRSNKNRSQTISPELELKFIVLGGSGVGKSSMIRRFCQDVFTQNYLPTIGPDFFIKTFYQTTYPTLPTLVKLTFVEIPLPELRSSPIRHFHYFKDVAGIVMIVDLNVENYIKPIEDWNHVINNFDSELHIKEVPRFLLINKVDDDKDIAIYKKKTETILDKYIRRAGFSGCKEISCKNGRNVNESLDYFISEIIKSKSYKNEIEINTTQTTSTISQKTTKSENILEKEKKEHKNETNKDSTSTVENPLYLTSTELYDFVKNFYNQLIEDLKTLQKSYESQDPIDPSPISNADVPEREMRFLQVKEMIETAEKQMNKVQNKVKEYEKEEKKLEKIQISLSKNAKRWQTLIHNLDTEVVLSGVGSFTSLCDGDPPPPASSSPIPTSSKAVPIVITSENMYSTECLSGSSSSLLLSSSLIGSVSFNGNRKSLGGGAKSLGSSGNVANGTRKVKRGFGFRNVGKKNSRKSGGMNGCVTPSSFSDYSCATSRTHSGSSSPFGSDEEDFDPSQGKVIAGLLQSASRTLGEKLPPPPPHDHPAPILQD